MRSCCRMRALTGKAGASLRLMASAKRTICTAGFRSCTSTIRSTARRMSYERVSGPLHVGDWFGRTVGQPIILTARAYARLRYGIDLLQPSPLEAIRHSRVPVLLIHGAEDRSINPRHAAMLAAAGTGHVQLWLLPRAGAPGAWGGAHAEFLGRGGGGVSRQLAKTKN